MKLARIYKITNTQNNSIYIGQTTSSIEERFNSHVTSSASDSDLPLYKDMRTFGKDVFVIELITECLDTNKLQLEEYYINHFYEKGYAVYNYIGLKAPNSNRQRALEQRMSNGFDYSSEDFRYTMSQVTRGEKNGMYGKKGALAPNGQAVFALDDSGNVVHSFVSVREALKFLNIKGHSSLMQATKEGKKYRGYYWKKSWKKYA